MMITMKHRSTIVLLASFALLIMLATPMRINPGERAAAPKPAASRCS